MTPYRALHITNIPLHPEDKGSEFELRMDSVPQHCQVFADRATPIQATLLQPPQEYAAEAVARTGAVHGEKPLILVAQLMHVSDHKRFVFLLDTYVKHHVLVGMSRLVVYIGEGMASLVDRPEIKVRTEL